MTVVNTATGELVEGLDSAAAERRAMKISLRLDSIADNVEAVMPMIREAIGLRDDIALGYRSPGDYISDRFGNALSRLPVDLRRGVVKELTDAGLSSRALAPVVGVSDRMVRKDVAATSGGNRVPTSPNVPVEQAAGSAGSQDEAPLPTDAETSPAAEAPRPAITGIDGKTYSAKGKPQRRSPLPDQMMRASYKLRKRAESINVLFEDDRLAQNKEQISLLSRSDLLYVQRVVAAALEQLPITEG